MRSTNPRPVGSFSPGTGTPERVRGTRTSRAEMETIVRWTAADPVAVLCTANPAEARRWGRKGYTVRVLGRYRDGAPRTWEATVPARAISLRSLVGGELPKRAARRAA